MDLQNKEDELPNHRPPLGLPTLFQSALDFGHVPQGGHKTLQQVIINTNKHAVIWLAETSANRWLTLDPDRGVLQPGERQLICITANTASLEVGEYAVTLTFSLEGEEISMRKDTASMITVEESQQQPVQPEVCLNFGELRPDSTRILELVINNTEDREVTWNVKIGSGVQMTLEHLEDSDGHEIPAGIQKHKDLSGQVSLSSNSITIKPHDSKTISVTARADNLDEGFSYSTTLTLIKDLDATNPVQIPVLYYVTPCPRYDGGPKPPCDLPSHLSISQAQGTTQLEFTNPPKNAVEHQEQKAANGQVEWKLESDVTWLTIKPSSTGLFVVDGKAQVNVESRGVPGQTAHLTLKLNFATNPSKRPETDVTIPVTIVT